MGISPVWAKRELPTPDLVAVYVYADWCPHCRILKPLIDVARQEGGLDQKNILFVGLNLTDKKSIHQSILLAQQLGIGEYLKAQGSGTGYLAILTPDTGQELLRFQSDTTSSDILKKINSLLHSRD
jgi:thiol-disulfide isomerase/thioredoxin